MNKRNFLAMAAGMLAMADVDPFMRVPNRPQGGVELSDKSIALFFEPRRELKEFSIKGRKVMAYSKKDAIKRLKHQKKL